MSKYKYSESIEEIKIRIVNLKPNVLHQKKDFSINQVNR